MQALTLPFLHSFSAFDVLVLVTLAVHLHLQYRVWIRREEDIFAKYRRPGGDVLRTAKWAYYAKAVFLILLMVLQYLGVPFRAAFVTSFLTYAVLIQIFMPVKVYTVLQLVLGLVCLAELLLKQ